MQVEHPRRFRRMRQFLMSGSASLYFGVCPIVLRHIELEDKSDKLNDPLKSTECATASYIGFSADHTPRFQYTSIEWENAIFILNQFMHTIAFDKDYECSIVKEFSDTPENGRETVIFTLAAVTLIADGVKKEKIRHGAFLAVLTICKTTKEFFLFVQLRKLLSINTNGLASGKGFKKTVLKWYLNFLGGSKRLFLELIRSPGAFKWRHQDLLKLCHIQMNKLHIDYQIIFHYIFTNARRTKDKFQNVPEARDFLNFLCNLTFEDPHPTIDQYLARAQYIKNVFCCTSYLDFPPHCYVDTRMWTFVLVNGQMDDILAAITYTNLLKIISNEDILTSLVYNKIRHYDFSSYLQINIIFAINRCILTLGRLSEAESGNVRRIAAILDNAVSRSMKNVPKQDPAVIRTPHVFVDSENICKFKKVPTMDSMHNEIRTIQVALLMATRFQYSCLRSTSAFLFFDDRFLKRNCVLPMNLKNKKDYCFRMENTTDLKQSVSIDIREALKYCSGPKKGDYCILIYYRITEKVIQDAINISSESDFRNIEVILLGIQFNAELRYNSKLKDNKYVTVVNEFSANTIYLIESMINQII